jgi:hypothetical protein
MSTLRIKLVHCSRPCSSTLFLAHVLGHIGALLQILILAKVYSIIILYECLEIIQRSVIEGGNTCAIFSRFPIKFVDLFLAGFPHE